mmetsp:Transcript_37644/g.118514  ORF Transcript_37644/g.118514 Transcript_37644/m.118514 type:complete len:250 (-) Transcript_37644:577-1326(-)
MGSTHPPRTATTRSKHLVLLVGCSPVAVPTATLGLVLPKGKRLAPRFFCCALLHQLLDLHQLAVHPGLRLLRLHLLLVVAAPLAALAALAACVGVRLLLLVFATHDASLIVRVGTKLVPGDVNPAQRVRKVLAVRVVVAPAAHRHPLRLSLFALALALALFRVRRVSRGGGCRCSARGAAARQDALEQGGRAAAPGLLLLQRQRHARAQLASRLLHLLHLVQKRRRRRREPPLALRLDRLPLVGLAHVV